MIKIIRKKSDVDEIMSSLKGETAKDLFLGTTYAEKLENLIRKNPVEGIGKIVEFYDEALDKSYTNEDGSNDRAFVEATCGGPFEAIPRATYNAVGSVYPQLSRENKDLALRQLFKILDKRNYFEVQIAHTNGIREPLLFSDIAIMRPLYWPGLSEGIELVKKYKKFQTIKEALIDGEGLFFHSVLNQDFKEVIEEGSPLKIHSVNSDFLVAYSFLRSDICDFGEQYAEVANPEFLDRVIRGAVALETEWAKTEEKGDKLLRQLLPKSLHWKIEPIRKRHDWVDPKKF